MSTENTKPTAEQTPVSPSENKVDAAPATRRPSRNPRNSKPGNGDHQSKDGDRPNRRRNNDNRGKRNQVKDDFEEKVVTINRVTKVTKGGRHFRFAAVVVIGNKKGQVGFGIGKANEVPDAIKKGVKEARKNIIRVSMRNTSVPHEILGQYGAGQVLIKPAKEGTGVIAGGPARAVIELAGIADIYAKSLGSNTPINMIRATLDGLSRMETLKSVQATRFGKVNTPKANTTNNTSNNEEKVAEKPAANA